MTPKEAVKIVEARSCCRTRYEGKEPYIDEILVLEIRRLQKIIHKIKSILNITNRTLGIVVGGISDVIKEIDNLDDDK
jgi:hypothetical protein